MVIFNSYVKLPEGMWVSKNCNDIPVVYMAGLPQWNVWVMSAIYNSWTAHPNRLLTGLQGGGSQKKKVGL